jgi:proteasome lid subunit RPN8/RPN11
MKCGISRALLSRLEAQAEASGGREICGLLIGELGLISAFLPLSNAHLEPERAFAFDPRQHIAAARAARETGQTLLGYYHSHPSGNAAPSRSDAAQAFEQDAYWLILAPGEARLWISRSGGAFLNAFEPVELVLS